MIVPVGAVVVMLCLFSAAAALWFSLLNFKSLIKPFLGATNLQGFGFNLDQSSCTADPPSIC